MKRDENITVENKKRLVLRKESIRALDSAHLSRVVGGLPPETSSPPMKIPFPTRF